MKRIVTAFLFLLIVTFVYSQNIRGYVKDEKGKSWLVVDVVPMKHDCNNMYIFFNKRLVEKFAKNLERWGKKAHEWTKTAEKENVKDFEKHIPNTQISDIMGLQKNDDFSFIHYTAYGIDFDTSISGAYVPAGTLYRFDPFFVIDPMGNCYLELRVELPEQKASSAVATESAGVAGTNYGEVAVGVSNSRQTFSYNPEGFSIKIRMADLDTYITTLKETAKRFGKNRDDYKEKKKLFK